MIDHAFEEVVRALRAVDSEHRIDRLEPVLRFLGIDIVAARREQRERFSGRHTTTVLH